MAYEIELLLSNVGALPKIFVSGRSPREPTVAVHINFYSAFNATQIRRALLSLIQVKIQCSTEPLQKLFRLVIWLEDDLDSNVEAVNAGLSDVNLIAIAPCAEVAAIIVFIRIVDVDELGMEVKLLSLHHVLIKDQIFIFNPLTHACTRERHNAAPRSEKMTIFIVFFFVFGKFRVSLKY